MMSFGTSVCREFKPPIRHENCHATCQKYIDERNAYEQIKKEINKSRAADIQFSSYLRSRKG